MNDKKKIVISVVIAVVIILAFIVAAVMRKDKIQVTPEQNVNTVTTQSKQEPNENKKNDSKKEIVKEESSDKANEKSNENSSDKTDNKSSEKKEDVKEENIKSDPVPSTTIAPQDIPLDPGETMIIPAQPSGNGSQSENQNTNTQTKPSDNNSPGQVEEITDQNENTIPDEIIDEIQDAFEGGFGENGVIELPIIPIKH